MSRVGKQPILLPENVKVDLGVGQINIEGPKGVLSLAIPDDLKISQVNSDLIVERKNDTRQARMNHGTIRQLLANMVKGVNQEWTKKLQVVGTGYVVEMKGKNLKLSLGFSHQIDFAVPEGICFEVDGDVVTVIGISRQLVGQVAYQIRSLRPPDAYKGKGIRYLGEEIKLKLGKAAKIGEGGGE